MPRLLSDRIGLRVHVEPVDRSIPVQLGTIISRKTWRLFGKRGKMPYIRLDDGRVLGGFECWWCAAEPDPVGRWSVRGWEPKPKRERWVAVRPSHPLYEPLLKIAEDDRAALRSDEARDQ